PACALKCAVRWVSSTDMPPARSTRGTSTAAGRNSVLGGVHPGLRSWSPRVACLRAAASAASVVPPNPRLPGCPRRAKRAITRSGVSELAISAARSFPFRPGCAQYEKHAPAPYPELGGILDPLLSAEIDQIVEHWS